MALYVNSKEADKVYRNNSSLKKLYVGNTLVWEAVKYIEKPTITGSFTFDTASHSCTLAGFDSNTMTKSGTETATAAGTYTVTITPKPGCAWVGGSTDAIDLTWSIAKRTLMIPSLTGTTTHAFVEGTTRSVSVANFNSTYETQGGTTSAVYEGNYTVTWALRYPASTQWSDGTTADKSASWSIGWVNGTSHYSNDIYNRGWVKNSSILVAITSLSYGTDAITITGYGSGAHIGINEASPSYTLHAEVYIENGGSAKIYTMNSASSNSGSSYGEGTTGYANTKNAWVEIYGSRSIPGYSVERNYFGLAVGVAINYVNNSKVRRIWTT